MTGTGVKTNGIGKPCKSHLNLRVTLKDWSGKYIVSARYPQIDRKAEGRAMK